MTRYCGRIRGNRGRVGRGYHREEERGWGRAQGLRRKVVEEKIRIVVASVQELVGHLEHCVADWVRGGHDENGESGVVDPKRGNVNH